MKLCLNFTKLQVKKRTQGQKESMPCWGPSFQPPHWWARSGGILVGWAHVVKWFATQCEINLWNENEPSLPRRRSEEGYGEEWARYSCQSKSSSSPWLNSQRLGSASSSNVQPAVGREKEFYLCPSSPHVAWGISAYMFMNYFKHTGPSEKASGWEYVIWAAFDPQIVDTKTYISRQ